MVDKNLLTISYEHKITEEHKNAEYNVQEFRIKNFKRSFKLNDTMNVQNIEAEYVNGVLMLNIPKKEESLQQIHEINIK